MPVEPNTPWTANSDTNIAIASKDYREFRAGLVERDRILMATGIEDRFVSNRIASYEKAIKPRQLRRH